MESCDSSNPEFRISLIHFHIGVVIHAPVWSATVLIYQPNATIRFQSTHPCGVRRYHSHSRTIGRCFNPRTRVGCDSRRHILPASCTCFNPRTRVGCDQLCVNNLTEPLPFQSTHPCGVRLMILRSIFYLLVSIHAPVWGATLIITRADSYCWFQSTHPCGVRLMALR